MKEYKRVIKDTITSETFLELLKAGVALFVAFSAPGALKLFQGSFKNTKWEEYYPSTIERKTFKLWRKGYVEIKETEGKTIVKLTEKGEAEIFNCSVKDLEINKPVIWDGKWRLVFFDIPEYKKSKRNVFQTKLKDLGFFPMQESVYVYPYPCEKEIKFLREVLEIPHDVKLIRADRIENDEDLRGVFEV